MASSKTIALRDSTRIKASVFVTKPSGKQIKETRMVSRHELGKVVHAGGTRVGFLSERKTLMRNIRQLREMEKDLRRAT